MKLQALRGATTSAKNSKESIEQAVIELVSELVKRNKLQSSQVVSVIFSVTKDLDACFPAAIARKKEGWEAVSYAWNEQQNEAYKKIA